MIYARNVIFVPVEENQKLIIQFFSLQLGCIFNEELKRNTFRRKNTFFMLSAVHYLNIELLGYGVNCWDLVCSCAFSDHQSICISCVFLKHKKPNSLNKSSFYLVGIRLNTYTKNIFLGCWNLFY